MGDLGQIATKAERDTSKPQQLSDPRKFVDWQWCNLGACCSSGVGNHQGMCEEAIDLKIIVG